jgi:16S rRNA (guanine527-N7)-methyltransferase
MLERHMVRSGENEFSDLYLSADKKRAMELTPVSNEVALRLDRLVALFLQWQSKMNLVARSTLPDLWSRHIADSLQLIVLAPSARVWIDLGSGGGFPGLVIACALAGQDGARVHLVESTKKKAAFLDEAVRILDLPASVHPVRIEEFAATFHGRCDIVTARALAPLDKLLELAAPVLKTGAKGLFLKGQDVEAELTDAAKCWTIDSTLVPSKTNPHGRVVVIHSAVRRDKQ